MKDKLVRWKKEINNSSKLFEEKFSQLDEQQLNWKPNPTDWSIGQNIDHLIQISTSFYPVLGKVIAGDYQNPWLAKVPFYVKFIEGIILKAVQPQNPRKTKTFPVWEPEASSVQPNVLTTFLREQEELGKLMDQCSQVLGTGIVIPSPANSKILYSLEGAFEILVTHQKRHYLQAEGVLRALNERAST